MEPALDLVGRKLPMEGGELAGRFFDLVKQDLQAASLVPATERIVAATGRHVGLGDWRPSSPRNPGKHGRFAVLKVKEIAEPDALPHAAE